MKSLPALLCGNLLFIHAVWSKFTFPKNLIIEIPTTVKGNLEYRYLGIKPNFTSQEAVEWWEKERPGYEKFVTEQIKRQDEERQKRPSPNIPNTGEIIKDLGSWGHYYDYGTKEIASWERRNPPAPNMLPLLDHYKNLKSIVLAKQRLRASNRTTEFTSGMKEEMRKLKEWAAEERKAGRMKCECHTGPTSFTERYTIPGKGGPWREGLFSLEKE